MKFSITKIVGYLVFLVVAANVAIYIFNQVSPLLGIFAGVFMLLATVLSIEHPKTKEFLGKLWMPLLLVTSLSSCDLVKSEHEGVLITNCGRNGLSDFKVVTGRVNALGVCTDLVKIPMYEVRGDIEVMKIHSRNNDAFTIDPQYGYQPIRGKGPQIAYNYKQFNDSSAGFLDAIEQNILNPKIKDIYREEARNYTTDSLLNNINEYEKAVEARVAVLFDSSYFKLKQLTSSVQPPERLVRAMELRAEEDIKAEQARKAIEREKANLDIERQKYQMQVELSRLKAEADKQRATGLTDQILKEMIIEKWDGKLPHGWTLEDILKKN